MDLNNFEVIDSFRLKIKDLWDIVPTDKPLYYLAGGEEGFQTFTISPDNIFDGGYSSLDMFYIGS